MPGTIKINEPAPKNPVDFKISAENENIKNIDNVLVVMSGKGGVGKSTVSTNLAVELSSRGYQVGLIDADMHGPDIPQMLGLVDDRPVMDENKKIVPVRYSNNLRVISIEYFLPSRDTPVIWRGALKHKMIEQFITDIAWGKLDFLIFDLPPGTGDEALSIVQLIPKVTGFVIVGTPQEVAMIDVKKAINFAKQLNAPVVGLIENMSGFVCPHCGETTFIFKKGSGEKISKEFGIDFLGSIPMEASVVEDGDDGTPMVLSHPESNSSKSFKSIVDRILVYPGLKKSKDA
ncbi:MAG: Mrp/NBP35 family ATP-binding protein [Candidatus Thermoplasmatota archaeon]|nr:Mrp/NBP35 family ATP-binding protein [Candidatus Thermoplasmatota archaeon]MCL5789043.1 Mrp/NBP35 family ATP-binding protein [Candidatus Thermoplasmatota archaeon]